MKAKPQISVQQKPTTNRWILIVALSSALFCSAVSAAFEDRPALDQFLQACGLGLPVLAAFVLKTPVFSVRAFRDSTVTCSLTILFLVSAGVSSILASMTAGTPYPLVFTTALTCSFLLYGGLWNFAEIDVLAALKAYALISTATYLAAWLLLRTPGERFSALTHPNYWGLLCFASFCLSGLFDSVVLRTAIQLANLIVIMAAEARSALLATSLAVLILAYFGLRSIKNKKNIPLLVLGAIFVCALTAMIFHDRLADLATDAFLLDDPYRGSQSGFTGREQMWEEGLKMFEMNPFFGVGARMEADYMAGGNQSAHSGYISTLAQYGAIGSVLFFSLAILSGRKLWVMAGQKRPAAAAGIALVLGYAVGAIFDPKLLSVGNPVSLLLIAFLFLPKQAARVARTDERSLPKFKPYHGFAKIQNPDSATPRFSSKRQSRAGERAVPTNS